MTHFPRRVAYICLFSLVAAQCVLTLMRAPTVSAAGATVYWGAMIKGATYGYGDAPWDTRTIDTFESHAGKRVSILHWGQPWYWGARGGYQVFQKDMAEKVRLRGSIPMITWTSEDLSAGGSTTQSNFQLGDIINGQHDAYVRQWARDAKAWGHPLFVRFDHEMNGSWYNWSELKNGNSSGQYVRMWQHVVNIFKQEGATNVTWVWAPNRLWSGSLALSSLYPGDSYVDWVGMSGYNWGTNPAKPNNAWQSFDDVFKQTYDQLGTLAPAKPLMITETSSSEYGGSKASWVKDVLTSTLPTRYPRIKALVWFNWNCPATNGNMDWVIESSSTAAAAYTVGIAGSTYATNTFGNLPLLSKVQPLSVLTSGTSGVKNGSFETTGSTPWYGPWQTKNTLGASFNQDSTTATSGSRSLKVSIPAASSTQPWQVQLRQSGQVLTKGKTYTITFYAKASTTRPLTLVFQDATSPYTEYYRRSTTLYGGWSKYTFTYVSGYSDSNVSLAVNFAAATGQVWLDNIAVVEQP